MKKRNTWQQLAGNSAPLMHTVALTGLLQRTKSHRSPVTQTLTGGLWASSQVPGPVPALQQSASGEHSHFKKTEIKWKNVHSLTDVIIWPGLTSVRRLGCQVHFTMCSYLVAEAGMCTCVSLPTLCILAAAAATFHSDILHPFNICVFMQTSWPQSLEISTLWHRLISFSTAALLWSRIHSSQKNRKRNLIDGKM